MKKSFFLVSLFAMVFLGLGSYTHAALCGDGFTNCTAEQKCVDEEVDGETISRCENICKPGEILVDNGVGGKECCDADCQALRKSSIGAPCDHPKGGTINALNICTCPSGYKPGTDPCQKCSDPGVCCGIELNTSVPFIGKCIESESANQGSDETNVTGETAFPVLMGSLTKILVTAILILSFVLIVIGGIMIATGNPSGGKKMIIKVVIGIAILGASGVILRLINPNFFG